MKIIDLEESDSKLPFLLFLTGFLAFYGLDLLESFIGRCMVLLIDLLGFSIESIFLIFYIFEGLIVFGLIFLIVLLFKRRRKNYVNSLVKLKQKHFKIFGIVFLFLFFVSFLFNYFTNDHYDRSLLEYVENDYKDSEFDIMYGQLILSASSVLKVGLLLSLFLITAFSTNKN